MNTNTTVSTKATKDADAVKTELTLDWEGMSEDDLRALAQQALIVKLQGTWRKNGIPAEATVKVAEHKVGTRAPRVAGAVNISAMTAEQRATLLAQLQASLEA